MGDTTNDVMLSMNNSKKPFSDVRVRLAITHAINKDEVLKGAMFGYGKILGSNVDPTNPYFVDVSKRVAYDPGQGQEAPGRGRLSRTASTRSSRWRRSTTTRCARPR